MSNHKKQPTTTYKSIGAIFCDLSLMLTPPENLSVSEAAEKFRYVYNQGSYVGPWRNSKTWYLVEPMNTFVSAIYAGLIFVGPAQSGKTDGLVVNTLAYSVKVDPMDMIIYCPGMTEARDFGLRRVDRLHRHSPEIGKMLLPTADADNRFDKQYTTGMLFTISWPTPSTLAGKPVPRICITDRDRMDDNIGNDGEVFDLAQKRNTTFGSYGMTLAESSPSREITNPRWIPTTPHEAPPCEGILKLYNRGDRRRWYWPCPHCGEYFEGLFKHLTWDDMGSPKASSETVRMVCPSNGCLIHPDERDEMQFWGVWLKDGQRIDSNCRITGDAPRTSIASFWLKGVAASFIKWQTLVDNYLIATEEYERTGSEEKLRQFFNNDLAEPYSPKSQTELRVPETLKARAENLGERVVPPGVRFLIATVDVQKNMFVVQVWGVLPGLKFDLTLIDRFDIRKSRRLDEHGERYWVKPHAYPEDWDCLIYDPETKEGVIDREYELGDGSGRHMMVKFTACDSGGKAGVTTNAYKFYRKLREENMHRRFILVKGEGLPNRPRTRIEFPDSDRKDMAAAARGDIPVLFFNSNVLKDDLNGRLDCLVPGAGMIHFPDWLSDSFYAELCVETRIADKGWINESGERQEAWDLGYYALGLCTSKIIGVEGIDWNNPPRWADEWDRNDLVRAPEQGKPFANRLKSNFDFAALAGALA